MSGERSVQPERSDRRCQYVMSRTAGCSASQSGPGRRHACGSQLSVVIRTRSSMADDIVQRAEDHLERTLDRVVDEQREVLSSQKSAPRTSPRSRFTA
jgi:hypothetical protein